jgi:glycosyltransferase involved in cell wall biosynthesis
VKAEVRSLPIAASSTHNDASGDTSASIPQQQAALIRKPRILLIAPRYPFPPIGGDRLRLHHLARMLSTRFDLTLASLCDTDPSTLPPPPAGIYTTVHCVYLPAWRSWANCAAAMFGSDPLQVAYFHSDAFAALIDRLAPGHDAVLAHLIRTAPYAAQLQLPHVLEMTDAISMNMVRSGRYPNPWSLRHWLYRIEADRVARFERAALEQFDLVSVVSPVDKAHLLGQANEASHHVMVVPNGVEESPAIRIGPTSDIVFVGNLASLQNQDALWFFVREVLPGVRQEIPSARLRVIGPLPPAQRRALGRQPGVCVLGQVESLAAAIDGAVLGVCPVRIGAGMQNKLLDYLAHGLPAITSLVGLEGIEATPSEHLLFANSPQQWIGEVVRVLKAPASFAAMAALGRQLVRERYGWAAGTAEMLERMSALIDGYVNPVEFTLPFLRPGSSHL